MATQIATHVLGRGVSRIFSPFSAKRLILGTAAFGVGSLAISTYLSPGIKKFIRSPQTWQVYRLFPLPLHQRKLALGGAVLVISAVIIYAAFSYLGAFLNSPFPKSFSLRLRSKSENFVIALVGTGVLLGTRYVISAFRIDISLNPLRLSVSRPKNQIVTVTKSTNQAVSKTGWAALPLDILGKYIFPLVISKTTTFKEVFKLAVCSTWKAALLHKDCLTSSNYAPHFLWVPMYYEDFDVMEVVAFFDKFLPADHTGEALLLPVDVLGCYLQNYITPPQLAYIVRRFPNVEIESLTLCIADEDNMETTAKLLCHFLEKGKIRSLTLACERLRNPDHTKFIGKILTKAERRKREDFNRQWRNSTFHANFPEQVMELLKHLKGQIPILCFQGLPRRNIPKSPYYDSEMKNLDVIEILRVLSRQEPCTESTAIDLTTSTAQPTPPVSSSVPMDEPKSIAKPTSLVLKITQEIRFQTYHGVPFVGGNNRREKREVTPFLTPHIKKVPVPSMRKALIERKPVPKQDENEPQTIIINCPQLSPWPQHIDPASLPAFTEKAVSEGKGL